MCSDRLQQLRTSSEALCSHRVLLRWLLEPSPCAVTCCVSHEPEAVRCAVLHLLSNCCVCRLQAGAGKLVSIALGGEEKAFNLWEIDMALQGLDMLLWPQVKTFKQTG